MLEENIFYVSQYDNSKCVAFPKENNIFSLDGSRGIDYYYYDIRKNSKPSLQVYRLNYKEFNDEKNYSNGHIEIFNRNMAKKIFGGNPALKEYNHPSSIPTWIKNKFITKEKEESITNSNLLLLLTN